VSRSALADRVISRAAQAGVDLAPAVAAALVTYLELLAKWNRRINLTALPVNPPTDDALDRLVVEPLVAAPHAGGPGAWVLDVGSGAGSPALPLKLARPDIRLVMVEARARKSAFLREAVRALGLEGVVVETGRIEDLVETPDCRETFDCVTLRAVRLDRPMLRAVTTGLKPGGVFLAFGSKGESQKLELFLSEGRGVSLPGSSELRVLRSLSRPKMGHKTE
jgi:16S rRNA (guanine527-N7)-methyltransferase